MNEFIEALQILDDAAAAAPGTRMDHIRRMNASQLVRQTFLVLSEQKAAEEKGAEAEVETTEE